MVAEENDYDEDENSITDASFRFRFCYVLPMSMMSKKEHLIIDKVENKKRCKKIWCCLFFLAEGGEVCFGDSKGEKI